jgi:hypothetical protein
MRLSCSMTLSPSCRRSVMHLPCCVLSSPAPETISDHDRLGDCRGETSLGGRSPPPHCRGGGGLGTAGVDWTGFTRWRRDPRVLVDLRVAGPECDDTAGGSTLGAAGTASFDSSRSPSVSRGVVASGAVVLYVGPLLPSLVLSLWTLPG